MKDPYLSKVRGPPVSVEPLRVLVVAGDPLARAGLAMMLASEAERFDVQQAGADPAASATQVRPQVTVWDVGADSTHGIELAVDTAPILALVPDEAGALQAIAAGASGALARDASAEEIVSAVTALSHGLAALDPVFLTALAGSYPEPERERLREPLTPREREVLSLLAEGLSNKEIAARLSISEHTAKFHVNAVLGKLGVQRRVEAVVRAARLGIIDL